MELILDETITLNPDKVKSNVTIPFILKKDYEKLEILCEYSPKWLEDMELTQKRIEEAYDTFVPLQYRPKDLTWERFSPLANHITFSLDYEKAFLGCAHRHPSVQKHSISKDNSSLGFVNHTPVRGSYSAVLNVHAIVTESVTYHLKVVAC